MVGLYAAAQLQIAQAGAVQLQFSHVPDAVWIDGKPLSGGARIPAELTAGTHTVVLRLDPKKLPVDLRLEATVGTFLAN